MGKKKSDLPQIKRVGEIIRLHRATIGNFKNYKTISINVGYSSSWCVFKGFDNLPSSCLSE